MEYELSNDNMGRPLMYVKMPKECEVLSVSSDDIGNLYFIIKNGVRGHIFMNGLEGALVQDSDIIYEENEIDPATIKATNHYLSISHTGNYVYAETIITAESDGRKTPLKPIQFHQLS